MISLVVSVVIVALIFGGFYYWARRQGLLTTGQAAEGEHGEQRISLLTEAVAYLGVILLLAGGAVAIGQRWTSIPRWGQVGVLAGAAAFFLLIGIVVRRVREPAMQRLAGVVWFLSVACVAGAVWLAWWKAYGSTGPVTVLVGGAVTVYSAALWLVRRGALQNVALFAGLIVTGLGIVDYVVDIVNGHGGTGSAPAIVGVLPLWAFGLAWAWLGWRRYVEPVWVTIPCGVILALIVPIFAVSHGWGHVGYAIGIATAAAVMAASVPLRNVPLLALGALAMFGYVTSAAVRYLHQSLGVPSALAITGVLIIGLAVVSARLGRAAHRPKPGQPGAERQSDVILPPEPAEPGAEKPSHRDLPKAS
jgi:hypothetical protein